jgi:DNA repair protein RadA
LKDIEGIGPTTAKKLKEAGIVSILELAVTSADQLSIDIDCSKETAATYIMEAQRLLRKTHVLEKEFVSANSLLEKRKSMLRCSTGSKSLDELLLGGIETQAVTEFYGEFGSGKSQVCFTLCAMAKQPISEGGLDGGVIYIDTEGTFRPERLDQIARARGFDPMLVLKNVAICKVYNSSHLELIIKDVGRYINEFNAKLVIMDSIVSLHRAEFPGRGTLADRQQRLNSILHKLVRVAEIFNIAVVITNQVQSSPDTFFGDPTKAAGGNIIAHTSTYRIYLRKSGENRIAKMIDSPYHPYSDIRFTVNEKGIDDTEETPKAKNKK